VEILDAAAVVDVGRERFERSDALIGPEQLRAVDGIRTGRAQVGDFQIRELRRFGRANTAERHVFSVRRAIGFGIVLDGKRTERGYIFRYRRELRKVHRVGGLRARFDVGDLAFLARRAH
jgi:hypothetical protein